MHGSVCSCCAAPLLTGALGGGRVGGSKIVPPVGLSGLCSIAHHCSPFRAAYNTERDPAIWAVSTKGTLAVQSKTDTHHQVDQTSDNVAHSTQ